MLILGCMYVKINNVEKKYSNILRNSEAYICTSQRTKDIKNKYTSMNFIVLKVKKNNIWHNINDFILTNVVIKNEDLRKYTIFYGDTFIINGSPRLIGSSGNININSFYKYYTQNGIHYNHFVDLYKIKYLGSKPISQGRYIFEKINYMLKTNTLKNIKNNDSKYILSNLLFGKGDDIKKELKESYIKRFYRALVSCYGIPPKQFDLKYTDDKGNFQIVRGFTPKSFKVIKILSI